MKRQILKKLVYELIVMTSSDLSPDVEKILKDAFEKESEGTIAKNVMRDILENVKLAREKQSPICQDTGLVNFFVKSSDEWNWEDIKEILTEAVQKATKEGILRPNAVDAVTGKNSGDNTGVGLPYFSFERTDEEGISIEIMLKGGGSENVGAQYRLPDITLGAGRDIRGVEKCILDAVFKAQGFGCAPGIIGVCIGGDRATSYINAKKQLLRKLDDINPDPDLRALEEKILKKSNELGIGPMGFGGKTTILGVKIGKAHRHPASFFVSVAYSCWADRRRGFSIKGENINYF